MADMKSMARSCAELATKAGKARLRTNDGLVQAACLLADMAVWYNSHAETWDDDPAHTRSIEAAYWAGRQTVEKALAAYRVAPNVAAVFREYSLTPLQSLILLILACREQGLLNYAEWHAYFPGANVQKLPLFREILPQSHLVSTGLIRVEKHSKKEAGYPVPSVQFQRVLIDPKAVFENEWHATTQNALLKRLHILRDMFNACVENIDQQESDSNTKEVELSQMIMRLRHAVKPHWPLSTLFSMNMYRLAERIVLALLCKATLFDPKSCRHAYCGGGREVEYYTGEWIARAVVRNVQDVPYILRNFLMPSSKLLQTGIIRPELSGLGDMTDTDEQAVRTTHFELTPEFLAKLHVTPVQNKIPLGRRPLVRMEQLALPPKAEQQIRTALAQISSSDMLRRWGVGQTIAYGRAVTMLFYGPPGTGKTACAEAVAHTLGKNIIVADYSKIINCYVGQTPKNIAKAFADARNGDCVLFWDEADALLFDRDDADKNWQVQDVNVLLQEIEKFEGVCILSTNRKGTLDKALARRISVKIEFMPPDATQARQIWQKLLPSKMPLARNVRLEELCAKKLTGGEIKNVILNAARAAAARGRRARVEQADFLAAIRDECEAKNTRTDLYSQTTEHIGF